MRSTLFKLAIGILAVSASPVGAQDSAPIVSAADTQSVTEALRTAGYDFDVTEREGSKRTTIDISSDSDYASVIFDDCNDAVPDLCDTLVLSTWWDRETPISDEAVAAANLNHKYVSVFRDSDGDAVMQWAILTRREGIPATVFLNALVRFIAVARDFDAVVFDGDRPAQDAGGDVAATLVATGQGDA